MAGFLAGALPLIIYNVRTPWATFQGNAVFSTEELPVKARMAKLTMDGSSLFGYLAHDEWALHPQPAETPLERASVAMRNVVGPWRSGLLFWAFVAAFLLAPFWRPNHRLVLFALIAMAVAWLQMAFNKNTGASAHHVVLLWPFPQMVVAVAFASATARLTRYRRPVLAAVVAVVCGANLLLLNQYFAQLVRYGAAGVWSDAIYRSRRNSALCTRGTFSLRIGENWTR